MRHYRKVVCIHCVSSPLCTLTSKCFIQLADGDRLACDRPVVLAILQSLLAAKVEYLFELGDIDLARYFLCLKHWYLRGLLLSPELECA